MQIKKQLPMLMLAAGSLTATAAATAAEVAAGDSQWKMSAELGIVVTSGNSETSSTNAKYEAVNERAEWRHSVNAEALGTSSTDQVSNLEETSAERYALKGKSDFKFNEFDYMFGTLSWEKDRFSGYEYQSTLAVGYGRRLIHDEDMELDLEIGPGVRKVQFAPDGQTETDGILRLAAKYTWDITKTSKFSEDFITDISSDLTSSKSVTALTAKVNSSLAMKISVTIKHNSEVPVAIPATDKTDTETAVTLVYSF